MKRPNIMWHVPLDAKYSKEDGYWVYIPFWIVRAYRLLDKYGKPMINLNGRIALRIAEHGEAPIKYYRRYRSRTNHQYFVNNWSNKLNRERKVARKGGIR